jgi:type I restriction enzyme S subunit
MLKPYNEYRYFGLPWLEEIPSHWTMMRNKNVLIEKKEVVGSSANNYLLLSLTLNGVIARDMINAKGKFPKDFNTYKVVEPGNLIFCLFDIDETPRTVGLSPLNGMITGAYDVFQPVNINGKYLYYYYLSIDNVKGLKPLYTGLRKVINIQTFLGTKLPVPPKEEQNQIVRFLDWKLSKINKLIRAKKKQIALLIEHRKATIDNVIMYGINPHANRKESGVIWLGEIPSHWSVMKLKRICRINASITSQLEKYSLEDYVVFLPMENISSDGKIDCCEKRKLKDVRNGFSSFAKNDVIVAKITPCFENGKGACLDTLETNIGFGTTELIVLRANEKVLPRYLYMITQLQQFRIEGANVMTGSAGQKRVPSSFISNFELGIPSIAEQSEILEYLDNRLAKFDKLYETLNREIELLTEYRIRLISDVVTGKVDVRDIEIPEYEGDSDETIDGEIDDNIVLEEEGGEMEVE